MDSLSLSLNLSPRQNGDGCARDHSLWLAASAVASTRRSSVLPTVPAVPKWSWSLKPLRSVPVYSRTQIAAATLLYYTIRSALHAVRSAPNESTCCICTAAITSLSRARLSVAPQLLHQSPPQDGQGFISLCSRSHIFALCLPEALAHKLHDKPHIAPDTRAILLCIHNVIPHATCVCQPLVQGLHLLRQTRFRLDLDDGAVIGGEKHKCQA